MHIKINLQQNYINITLAFLIIINLKKTQKNPGVLFFFKKTRVFSSPAMHSIIMYQFVMIPQLA